MEMSGKKERLTLVTSREFKQHVTEAAKREGVSVSRLVQDRFLYMTPSEEEILKELVAELRTSVREARASIRHAIENTNAALTEIAARRKSGEVMQSTQKRKRGAAVT